MINPKTVEKQIVATLDELLKLRILLKLQSNQFSRLAVIQSIQLLSVKLDSLSTLALECNEFVNITRGNVI